jgi:serine/threonine-protein kinase
MGGPDLPGDTAPGVVELSELVACGGMGAVYRARQLSLDRWVALKIQPPELAADEVFRAGFEAEAKAMAKLAHSNLIGVCDFGPVEDMLHLVMEFVEGNTLYQSSYGQAVDPEVAVGLVKAVARGLGEAHGHGTVHRDIKPANILIMPELVPKLGDFGVSEELGGSAEAFSTRNGRSGRRVGPSIR